MEASKEISKERNQRPVRYWLSYKDPDVELLFCRSRALKVRLMVVGVGEVVGVFHMFIGHVFVKLFLQLIRIGTHISLALIYFCHMNF